MLAMWGSRNRRLVTSFRRPIQIVVVLLSQIWMRGGAVHRIFREPVQHRFVIVANGLDLNNQRLIRRQVYRLFRNYHLAIEVCFD